MPGRPLTILQLTHQGGPAGSTQSIFNLSEHLARRGHRVLVGCRDDVLLARLARAARLDVVPFDFTRLGDRKSTRLNSSHLVISYAVFCLKKKKKKIYNRRV